MTREAPVRSGGQAFALVWVFVTALSIALATLVAVSGLPASASQSYLTPDVAYDRPVAVALSRTAEWTGPVVPAVDLEGAGSPATRIQGHVYDRSSIFVAPRTAAMGDSFLANGSTVHYSSTATAIGDDANTLQNLARSRGANGHDVIVHGKNFGGEKRFFVDGQPVHTQQIADAILANPDYRGGPISLVTCGGGCGPADELAEILGVRVTSSRYPVDLDPRTGLLREFP